MASLLGCGGPDGVTIQGAGATFPETLYKRWFREFYEVEPGTRASYQGVGSGAGIKQFTAGFVDFGATDAPLSSSERQAIPEFGVQMLPMTAGMIVLAYHLPDVPRPLMLRRTTYVGIFLGEITRWDDPAIVADNPGLALPSLDITVVRRSDGSGTTNVFTSHLAAISPAWKRGPGVGKSISWPVGIGARGNPGVAFTIRQVPGAIGYLEYSFAKFSGLTVASLENRAHAFVEPTVESAGRALSTAELDDRLVATIPDPLGEGSYPIVSYTWLLCRKRYDRPEVGEALKRLLRYAIQEGQSCSEGLGYVPLPEAIAGRVRRAIDDIQVGAAPG